MYLCHMILFLLCYDCLNNYIQKERKCFIKWDQKKMYTWILTFTVCVIDIVNLSNLQVFYYLSEMMD